VNRERRAAAGVDVLTGNIGAGMAQMTSRERLLTCFAHRQPDRCPTYIWYTPDGMETLMEYLGETSEAGVIRALGVDEEVAVTLDVETPLEARAAIDALVPEEFRDNDDYAVDEMGRVTRVHEGVEVLEDTVWVPLAGVQRANELSRYPLPRPEWIEAPDDFDGVIRAHKEAGRLVRGEVVQAFKLAWLVRGMEDFLMDYFLHEDIANALYDAFYSFNTACGEKLVQAGVDVLVIGGDLGMQDRLIMSPDTWRAFDKPRLSEMIRTLKAINPEVKVYMHTDGDVSAIIPDLIDAGLDILNPIQPECMDPVEIKREFGDRLVLHGCTSLQRTLPFGSIDDVKSEVRHLIEHCNVSGGFVLGPSNEIFKGIPPQNVVAMYEASREFGT